MPQFRDGDGGEKKMRIVTMNTSGQGNFYLYLPEMNSNFIHH
jgi:hypothetical protein